MRKMYEYFIPVSLATNTFLPGRVIDRGRISDMFSFSSNLNKWEDRLIWEELQLGKPLILLYVLFGRYTSRFYFSYTWAGTSDSLSLIHVALMYWLFTSCDTIDQFCDTIDNFCDIVSVLHQNEGGIGKSIPDAQEISRDPRDFPRAKPEGNLEGR